MLHLVLMVTTLGQALLAAERIPAFTISNSELKEMSKKLRDADENKASRGQIHVNFQGHTTTRDQSDNAASRLFIKVDESLLEKPSYKQFLALANNFNRETGSAEPRVSVAEVSSNQGGLSGHGALFQKGFLHLVETYEKSETSAFLTTVLQSKPWKMLYEFLHKKGHPFATSPIVFRYWIAQLWFVHYSRARGKADTSGFEHVFMGEEKNREITGMHNWLRFYTLEKNATENFDYKGFVIKRGNVMASVKFTWKGDLKRSGSILLGTSPEYDMALYTLCFLSRRGRDQCEVEIDGCPLAITSFEIIQNNKVFIGSIFPTAGPLTEQCRRLSGRV